MLNLEMSLRISRCPHCSVDTPNLTRQTSFITSASDGSNQRHWSVYQCNRCGGVVSACSYQPAGAVIDYFPKTESVADELPSKVKSFLQQAMDCTFTPSGSLMLCASAVDAMLKEKGLIEGSLYTRIKKAVETNLITPEMETWAHHVRLEANDQRHADHNADLPTTDAAKKALEFTKTLADILFVLPKRVKKGLDETAKDQVPRVPEVGSVI